MPKRTPKPKTSISPTGLDPASIQVFNNWCLQMGFKSHGAAFYYLVRAIQDDRLHVWDKATKDILVGAAKEETLLQARMAARQEALIVLWEQGFISDPGGLDTFVRPLDVDEKV